MMNDYNWRDVAYEDAESLIEKINTLSAIAMFEAESSSLETADLCFYKHFKLLQATTFDSIPPVTMQYLVGGNSPDWTVVKLDGTKAPIFEINPQAGLILNEETVVQYACFVLDSTMSEDGSMRLVENVDKDTFTYEPTPAQRDEVTRLIRPAIVKKTDHGFDLDAIVLYGDSVYRADLSVKNDGFVEIISEELLAEGMPIRPIFLE